MFPSKLAELAGHVPYIVAAATHVVGFIVKALSDTAEEILKPVIARWVRHLFHRDQDPRRPCHFPWTSRSASMTSRSACAVTSEPIRATLRSSPTRSSGALRPALTGTTDSSCNGPAAQAATDRRPALSPQVTSCGIPQARWDRGGPGRRRYEWPPARSARVMKARRAGYDSCRHDRGTR